MIPLNPKHKSILPWDAIDSKSLVPYCGPVTTDGLVLEIHKVVTVLL